jgi:glutathione S-transferase
VEAASRGSGVEAGSGSWLPPADGRTMSSPAAAAAGTGAGRWAAVTAATQPWSAARLPRAGTDVALTLYRDANGWCPHCHKVFWFMEQMSLRYRTERIHLQGDPREPPKQPWFVRDISPSGAVPVLSIGDEHISESLDILRRLEREFPEAGGLASVPSTSEDPWVSEIIRASGAFDCDSDAWLQNTEGEEEQALNAESRKKFGWLEQQLGRHTDGPFFLGPQPSWLDALYVGFLSRAATNYQFFKQWDVTAPAEGSGSLSLQAGQGGLPLPRLSGWLTAMRRSRGGQRTWQPPSNDQRVYQSHPARRGAAEPCQQLHPCRLGVRASDIG